MGEMIFSYKPIEFAESNSRENRISKADYINKMEREGTIAFLKKSVITPFEDALKTSGLESIACGEFKVGVSNSPSSSTSWKGVYDNLINYLAIRAEDSRAFSSEGMRYVPGIGYCMTLDGLYEKINQFIQDATEEGSSRALNWPKKKKTDSPMKRISLPDREYSKLTEENAVSVLKAKRFSGEIGDYVITPFENELKRWFEANTGYHPPEKIPDKQTQCVPRTLEIAEGSYMHIQLVRKETPRYEKIIANVRSTLRDIKDATPASLFKHVDQEGIKFVNISSVNNYLGRENLEKNDLIKVESRYEITP